VRLSALRFKFGSGTEANINSPNDVKLKDRDSGQSGQRQGGLQHIDWNRNKITMQTILTKEAQTKPALCYRCSIGRHFWNILQAGNHGTLNHLFRDYAQNPGAGSAPERH